jgi:hypothetical protein
MGEPAPDAACKAVRRDIARITADGARVLVLAGRDDESLDGLEADFGPRGALARPARGRHGDQPAQPRPRALLGESQDLALTQLLGFLGLEETAPSSREAPPDAASGWPPPRVANR